ncbi:hypothetical protein GH714_017452 [Hevea brasiliensis]|uniref:Peptidase A1 domain-containing protein n=1 Tax=Hevea brasiliensis TaxID=3981 RepID=A0A6A6NB58_HEVBR|nr:hypothetical protein GH714_017452 [Hevea brasiliensis]
MQAKDQARLQYLSSLVARKSVVPVASGRQITQSPTYIVSAKIGTPAQTMLLAMDTSNDVAWLPCSGCVGCSSAVFNSAKSTTFKTLGCQAAQCKQSVPPQGLLGLGRGPLSLLSQSQKLYKSTFSYCLPSFRSLSFSGSLRLGPIGQPKRIKTTPLLKNPRRSSLYYVNLVAIRVGRRVVDIPPSALAFNPTTGAGTIFDSGTVFTRLVTPAYTAVRDAFRKRVGMQRTAGSITCLAMAAAPDNVNSVLNVIANMQQQNHRILYDVPNSRIGVARERCT